MDKQTSKTWLRVSILWLYAVCAICSDTSNVFADGNPPVAQVDVIPPMAQVEVLPPMAQITIVPKVEPLKQSSGVIVGTIVYPQPVYRIPQPTYTYPSAVSGVTASRPFPMAITQGTTAHRADVPNTTFQGTTGTVRIRTLATGAAPFGGTNCTSYG